MACFVSRYGVVSLVAAALLAGPVSTVQAQNEPRVVAKDASPADRKRLERFEQQLEQLRRLLRIPGMSAVIVRDQEVLWARGFGKADLEKGTLAGPATVYHIASLTKTFAATLIMQLVEQGKLSLDEPVSKYSTDFKDNAVRIKHLLSHTSAEPPGEAYRYDGGRYDYLTAVIEKLTDKPFRLLLAESFMDPLGMSNTVPGQDVLTAGDKPAPLGPERLARYKRALERLARPYRHHGQEIVATPYPPQGIGAAAGLLSTVLDLAKYDAAIDRQAFIKAKTQEQAWTPFTSTDGKRLPHGLGWFAEDYQGLKLVWHFGYWPNSFSALLLKIPDKNLSFYLLANSDALSSPPFYNRSGVEGSPFACTFLRLFVFEESGGRALPDPDWTLNAKSFAEELGRLQTQAKGYPYRSEAIAHEAVNQWLQERRAKARKEIKVDAKRFDLIVGRYSRRPDGTGGFTISTDETRLVVELPRLGKLEMFPESETTFFLKGMDMVLTFVKDEKGNVTHLEFQTENQKGRLKKVN